ncbi:hypothetical protein AAC387_Pa03g1631 [Persea americana]
MGNGRREWSFGHSQQMLCCSLILFCGAYRFQARPLSAVLFVLNRAAHGSVEGSEIFDPKTHLGVAEIGVLCTSLQI